MKITSLRIYKVVGIVVATSLLVAQQQNGGLLVNAFPNQAGSCVGGQPAVGGPHTSTPTITNGTLEQFDMTFTMNKYPLTPNTAAVPFYTQFQSGIPFDIAINASKGDMKGCLIRFQTEDNQPKTVFDITTGDNTQIASICDSFESATGLCHTNNNDKAICGGSVTANVNGRIIVDVTVVLSLEEDQSSTFAYNQYVLESIVSFPPHTSTPTITKAPAMVPAPVASPTATGSTTTAPVPLIGNVTLNPAAAPVPIIGNFTFNPTSSAVSDAPSSQPSMITIGGMSDMPSSSPSGNQVPSGAPFIIGDLPSAVPSATPIMASMPTALPLVQDQTGVPSAAPVSSPISNAVSLSNRFITILGTTVMGFVIVLAMM